MGVKGHLHTNKTELEGILRDGSQWAQREGYARPEDVAHTEERGRMAGANPDKVSKAAKERGLEQVGTLGSGNHFAEIDEVTEIFDAEAAAAIWPAQGAGRLSDSLRQPRAGPPGGDRLHRDLPACVEEVRLSNCPTASWCARRWIRPRARPTWPR